MSLTNIVDHDPLAYSIADFCRLIGLGRSTVYAMIDSGEIQVAQIGNRKLIPRAEATALLERSIVKPSKAA
jgi:excisionase family DNA binding protein